MAMTPIGSTTVPSMDTTYDVADFSGFYADHHRRAVGLAYALCGDRAIAEELAHDAFTIVAHFGQFEPPRGMCRSGRTRHPKWKNCHTRDGRRSAGVGCGRERAATPSIDHRTRHMHALYA